MSQQSGQHPISLQYPVRTSKAGYQLAGPGERPCPQAKQANLNGSKATAAVHKNADLVPQFSVHMQSIETAGIARKRPTERGL
jgi:hypothetical protein